MKKASSTAIFVYSITSIMFLVAKEPEKNTTTSNFDIPINFEDGRTLKVPITLVNNITFQLDVDNKHEAPVKVSVKQDAQAPPVNPENNAFSDFSSGFQGLVTRHKFVASAALFGLPYALLYSKVASAGSLLNDTNSWSAWKNPTPLLNLAVVPQGQLLSELLNSIEERYSNGERHGFAKNMHTFLLDVAKEIKTLGHYITLHKWINFLHIGWLFPFKNHYLNECKERIQRLEFLRSLVSLYKHPEQTKDVAVEAQEIFKAEPTEITAQAA